jgi:hypothetical protein
MPDTSATEPSDRSRSGAATVAVFGVLAGLAGIEHGVGEEILQGDVAPSGVAWPLGQLVMVTAWGCVGLGVVVDRDGLVAALAVVAVVDVVIGAVVDDREPGGGGFIGVCHATTPAPVSAWYRRTLSSLVWHRRAWCRSRAPLPSPDRLLRGRSRCQ